MALVGCADVRETAQNRFEPATPGTLVVAADIPEAGFWEGTPDNVTGGFEYALAQALADRLGLDLEVIEVPFEDVVAGRLGPADVALQEVSVDRTRAKQVDFSVPYLTTAPTVVARRGSGDAAELRDLATARDVRWSVREQSTLAQFLDEVVRPKTPPATVATTAAALAAVEDGTVDAALVDLADALLADAGSEALVTVARFDRSEDVAVVLPDGATANVTAVDQALRTLRTDGTLDRLVVTWLTSRYPFDPRDIAVIATR